MKYTTLTSLFALLIIFLSACNTQPIPTSNEPLVETQEFIISSERSSAYLQAASTSTTPRLLVRLSIKPELDVNGAATGKRYGQVEFYWADKARSKGGSNLGGIASIMLRDANSSDIATEGYLASTALPIMSNIDLYKQPGYEDHIVKTSPVSFNGPLCIEVSSLNFMSTNGYVINHKGELTDSYDTIPMLRLCDKNSKKSGVDLRLAPLKSRVLDAISGSEFTLSMAVINSGSDVANDVTVTYKIPYAEELIFVKNTSKLFTCTATTQTTTDEGLVMTVSCSAAKLSVGIKTLPLVFSSTKEAAIYSGLFEFYMNISTLGPETDTTNNTADSFVIVY
jgi:hypothetical protein